MLQISPRTPGQKRFGRRDSQILHDSANAGFLDSYRIIRLMARIDLHFKVTVDLDEEETPEKFAAEICRTVSRIYGVESAELSNYVRSSD
jgi:hypothetical protein